LPCAREKKSKKRKKKRWYGVSRMGAKNLKKKGVVAHTGWGGAMSNWGPKTNPE